MTEYTITIPIEVDIQVRVEYERETEDHGGTVPERVVGWNWVNPVEVGSYIQNRLMHMDADGTYLDELYEQYQREIELEKVGWRKAEIMP